MVLFYDNFLHILKSWDGHENRNTCGILFIITVHIFVIWLNTVLIDNNNVTLYTHFKTIQWISIIHIEVCVWLLQLWILLSSVCVTRQQQPTSFIVIFGRFIFTVSAPTSWVLTNISMHPIHITLSAYMRLLSVLYYFCGVYQYFLSIRLPWVM